MYIVRQSGRMMGKFSYFFDAWLYIKLELQSHALVIGPDGQWVVEPIDFN